MSHAEAQIYAWHMNRATFLGVTSIPIIPQDMVPL